MFTSEFSNSKQYTKELLNQILLRLCIAMEEGKVAFKGSYALKEFIPISRNTQDIGMSVAAESAYSHLKEVLRSYAEELKQEQIINRYEIKEEITPNRSGGIKLFLDDKLLVAVDVSLHNLMYGILKTTIDGENVWCFSIERMLADKLSVICSRKRFRRAKDLYDTWAIITYCDVNYEELMLCLSERQVDFNLIPNNEPALTEYLKAYDSLILEDIRDGSEIERPAFKDIMTSLAFFIEPITTRTDIKEWKHGGGGWR